MNAPEVGPEVDGAAFGDVPADIAVTATRPVPEVRAGQATDPDAGQRFWWHRGIFYSEIGTRRHGGAAVMGEWKMSGMVGAVPDDALEVWFGGPASDGGPSDAAGLSWHEACVQARLEGAHARTEREQARQRVTALERERTQFSGAIDAERTVRHGAAIALEAAVSRLEQVYGGDGRRADAALWQEAAAGEEPTAEWPREYWTTHPTDEALARLTALVGELADSPHPSVVWPQVAKRVRTAAAQTFRHALGTGATLEQALELVLEEAAGSARTSGATSPSVATTDRQE